MKLINKICFAIFMVCVILLAVLSSLQTRKIHQLEQQIEEKNQQLRLTHN